MSVTLCEECFPDWRNTETLSVNPLRPCQLCGSDGERNVFRESNPLVIEALREAVVE